MREWTRCVDAMFATRLQQALDGVGIESEVTSEIANAYLGRMEFVVWVDDHADQAEMERACRTLLESRDLDTIRETRVSASDEMLECRSCGYDLRGQPGDGKCPECGHAYKIVTQRKCPKCQEEVPSDFDVCWNCGEQILSA